MLKAPSHETEAFLRLLDFEGDHFLFMAMPESEETKNSSKPVIRFGKLVDHSELLKELNSKGYGIFVCVNETKGVERTAKDVTRIRAVWHDDDTKTAGVRIEHFPFPLRLSSRQALIIFTGIGLLKTGLLTRKAERILLPL